MNKKTVLPPPMKQRVRTLPGNTKPLTSWVLGLSTLLVGAIGLTGCTQGDEPARQGQVSPTASASAQATGTSAEPSAAPTEISQELADDPYITYSFVLCYGDVLVSPEVYAADVPDGNIELYRKLYDGAPQFVHDQSNQNQRDPDSFVPAQECAEHGYNLSQDG